MFVFSLQHIGPAIPEVSSIWFKLYLYHVTGQGPPSLLLSKGSRLRKLPDIFQVSPKIIINQVGRLHKSVCADTERNLFDVR